MAKIDLITGILGSGKTTFLHDYALHLINKGLRIAILENDFGAVNVDMLLLDDLRGENCQIEMIVGGGDKDCHKRRFKTQLINLGMQHFDRVIVEPSGIFDMDEFFDTLHESPIDRWFETGNIITMIDAAMPENLPAQTEYLLGSQAACCGKMVVSKLDTVENEQQKDLPQRLLSHINRAMTFIQCSRSFVPDDLILRENVDFDSLINCGYRNSSYVKHFSSDDIGSTVRYFMNIRIPENEIYPVIEAIMSDAGCGEIARLKGYLPADNGGWLKVNATRKSIETAPVMRGQAVLIAIGENVSRSVIDRHLSKVNTDKAYVSI